MDRMQSGEPTPCHVASLSCVDMLDPMNSVSQCAGGRGKAPHGMRESDGTMDRMQSACRRPSKGATRRAPWIGCRVASRLRAMLRA